MPQKNYENEPIGTIILESSQILKVCRPLDKDGEKTVKEISDFGIQVLAKCEDQYLIAINGKLRVENLDFSTALQGFRRYIRPYFFSGTVEDVEAIAAILSRQIQEISENSLIIIKNRVGKIETDQFTFWVFQDRILVSHINKKKLPNPDEYMITKSNILKIGQFYVYVNNDNVNQSLLPVYGEPKNYTLNQFLDDWMGQLENKYLLYSLLGWMIAGVFMEDMNKVRGCRFFPFYVLTASTETGKTALLANCIKAMGFDYVGENFANSVTRFVEVVEFSQVSHLPIWRDEYKNEGYVKEKEGWLRSVYTRSSNSRGTKTMEVMQYPTYATLLLSGEDITEDSALSRRMLKVRLTKEDRVTKAQHEKNTKNAQHNFHKFLPLLIQHGFNLQSFTEIFTKQHIPNDTMYQDELMCFAALGAVFGEEIAIKALESVVIQKKKADQDIASQRPQTIEDFFDEVKAMFLDKDYYSGKFGAKPKALDYFVFAKPPAEPNTVFLRMKELHPVIQKWRPHNTYQWTRRALTQLIVEVYKGILAPRIIDGKSERIIIINNIHEIEDGFGELLGRLQQVSQDWDESQQDNLPPKIGMVEARMPNEQFEPSQVAVDFEMDNV